MTGRLGVYVHSDSATPDKGGCMLVVRTQTDFASRTPEVKKFADRAAMFCYGISDMIEDAEAEYRAYQSIADVPRPWEIVAKTFPGIEIERQDLEKSLRETIEIVEFSFLKV